MAHLVILLSFSAFILAPVLGADVCQTVAQGTSRECLDANTVVICVDGAMSRNMTCGRLRPYCSGSGVCQRDPPFECKAGMEGYFPDPSQCKMYHFCLDGAKQTYTCSGRTVYSAKTHSCVVGERCYEFNCRGKNGKKVPYPGDPAVYASCNDGSAMELAACEGGMTFSSEEQKCGHYCETEGLIADPAACNQFFQCVRAGPNRIDKVAGKCIQGAWFDPALAKCTRDHGNCKDSTTSTTISATSSTQAPSTTASTSAEPSPSVDAASPPSPPPPASNP